jgi:hypothetical protein
MSEMLRFLLALRLLLVLMFDWYVAPALVKLTTEANARWPNRDKSSDGSIGDAAHRNRKSDHNPNARGSVNAKDLDKDGIDTNLVLEMAKRHPSVNYIIWNGWIYSRFRNFVPVRYTGTNKHTMHMHISLIQSAAAENDRRDWGIASAATPAPPAPTGETPAWAGSMGKRPMPLGAAPGQKFLYSKELFAKKRDGNTYWIQWVIKTRTNYSGPMKPDGYYGQLTHEAVWGFQGAVGLKQDGKVGRDTWDALNRFA